MGIVFTRFPIGYTKASYTMNQEEKKYPLPPFTLNTALEKVQKAERSFKCIKSLYFRFGMAKPDSIYQRTGRNYSISDRKMEKRKKLQIKKRTLGISRKPNGGAI